MKTKQIVEKERIVNETYHGNRKTSVVTNVTSKYHAILHSEKGPAVVNDNGDKYWYRMGVIHRDGGPAAINSKGEFWFSDGVYHRSDGPAIILNNGHKNGIYTESVIG